MAGLVPAIHVLPLQLKKKDVDARDKRGHDELLEFAAPATNTTVILRRLPRSGEPRRIGSRQTPDQRPRLSFETPRKSAAPQDDGGDVSKRPKTLPDRDRRSSTDPRRS
jgi:hypothetical protein